MMYHRFLYNIKYLFYQFNIVSAYELSYGCKALPFNPSLYFFISNTWPGKTTPENCENFCTESSYKYFALSGGCTCHCADKLSNLLDNINPLGFLSAKDKECRTSCCGEPSEDCGGMGYMELYRTSVSFSITEVEAVEKTEVALPSWAYAVITLGIVGVLIGIFGVIFVIKRRRNEMNLLSQEEKSHSSADKTMETEEENNNSIAKIESDEEDINSGKPVEE